MKERFLSALMLAALTSLVWGYLWWGRFQYYDAVATVTTYVGCLVILGLSHYLFADRRLLGFRWDNLVSALKIVAPPTIVLALLILLWSGGTPAGESRRSASWVYIPWALIQQYVLQAFILRRFQVILGDRAVAVFAAATLFALFHLPNLALMTACFVAGLVWCAAFSRAPNILATWVSHACLGLLLGLFLKHDTFEQFRVGGAGFRYSAYGDGVRVSAGHDSQGRPVIVTGLGPDRANRSTASVFGPEGALLASWEAFPDSTFGLNVAVGDLGFGPGDELAAAPGPGASNPSEVRVFSLDGNELSRFDLPVSTGYGASVSVDQGRILAAAGPGPAVGGDLFLFDPQGHLIRRWDFSEAGFENSIRAQAFTSPDGASRIAVWGSPLVINPARLHIFDGQGQSLNKWDAYNIGFALNLSLIRRNRGGAPDLLTGPGPGRGNQPHIRIFSGEGQLLDDRFPYQGGDGACGAEVAALDVDGDGRDEIVLGEGGCPGQAPTVRIFDLDGQPISSFSAERPKAAP